MLSRRHAQRGFNLIELLIGMAIVFMILAQGVPNFGAWIQSSKIRTAAESIQNGLSLARAEAVRRNTNVKFALQSASSWSVGCVVAVAVDEAAGTGCPGQIQARSAAEGSAQATVALSEQAAGTGAAPGSSAFVTGKSVSFNGLGRAGSLPAGNEAVFDIANPTGGACAPAGKMRCLRIIVGAAGQVRMCDPALPHPTPGSPLPSDAQAC